MNRIQVLSPIVIHQIAAGEVADRPATIIKELIENALDASATHIKIEVELNRLPKIIVSDNGTGMSADDLLLAPLRHTTSKISRFEDLQNLDSFGFRGEALAAMAFASRLTIMSRLPTEHTGYAVTAEQDKVSPPRPVGMAVGTVVIIENLFENLPARQKFLKKPATELKAITDVIAAAAVSQPAVAFVFESQHKRLLSLPAQQHLVARSLELFRLGQTEDLLELEIGTSPLKLTGWIGKPHLASYARQKQVWVINQRPVNQPELSQVVKHSYGSLLEPRAEPSFVLHLEVPPSSIDINSHPKKEAVTFSHTSDVFQLIASAVSQRLAEADLSFGLPPDFGPSTTRANAANQTAVKKNVEQFADMTNTSWQPGSSPAENQILQIGRTYLLRETKQGFELVDQHAAHERILFESFLAQLSQKPAKLEPAIAIHPSFVEKKTYLAHKSQLAKIGFEAEDFGQDVLKLSQVPTILTHQPKDQVAELFLQILDELGTAGRSTAWEEQQRMIVASLACHSAVRAGDYLTPTQRQELLDKLPQTPHAATCPHGRPTTIKVSFKELAQLFHRQK